MNKVCQLCRGEFTPKHFNSKACDTCRPKLKRLPLGRLTPDQEACVHKFAGTMYIHELAEKVGVSKATLKRWAIRNKVDVDGHTYRPEIIEAVTKFYEQNGRAKTEKEFPSVRVRSVVERYRNFEPRQKRWTNSELIEVARMAGLVSFSAQPKFFNRPGANEGSIKSVWMKKFKFGQGQLNGLQRNQAKHLITNDCPAVLCEFLARRDLNAPLGNYYERRVYLWVDMEKHLRSDLPEFMRSAIKTLAGFQRWLFDSSNPKPWIERMITEREEPTLEVS